jgi:hypothetical protein
MATSVTGSVYGSSGAAQNVRIDFWNPTGFNGVSGVSSTFTDASGNYTVTIPSAGTYAVKAVPGTTTTSPYTGAGYGFTQDVQTVTVDGTSTTNLSGLNFTIVPPASVNPTR